MKGKKQIYLVGMGMGTLEGLTLEARNTIESCDVLVGAKRMLEPFFECEQLQENGEREKILFTSYHPKEIGDFLRAQSEMKQGAVLLSGDVGFYSGAKGLLTELQDFQITMIPGISSLVYFCSRLKVPWEEICFTSVHGKDSNLICRIWRHKRTFALLGGGEQLKELCQKLVYYGMEDVMLHIGERLSYPEERVVSEKAGILREKGNFDFDNLLVVLAENEKAVDFVAFSIPDEEFVRSKVPMTKSEVRAVSVGKMKLTSKSLCYDIGAGTGSVSIEIAMQSPNIKVFSIEKNPEAIKLLEKNKQKFCADNMEIIFGQAPSVLEELPAPTAVFIGGSAGNLSSIIDRVFAKNRECRIVIHTVSLNSLAEVMEYMKKHSELETDIVQMQTAKNKKLGSYQMMMGQNPIYIITMIHKGQKSEIVPA
ncbi:MAG: precorrin-6y C5,15-methyltransferase (decarboxylating) subunit CbiE [Lachnospiraceae bacterium]|nr:precorrin-6y C5,15-methyltransferase (decarboxylating) subunit CbiE [Lachnospiraceae bacterium]